MLLGLQVYMYILSTQYGSTSMMASYLVYAFTTSFELLICGMIILMVPHSTTLEANRATDTISITGHHMFSRNVVQDGRATQLTDIVYKPAKYNANSTTYNVYLHF